MHNYSPETIVRRAIATRAWKKANPEAVRRHNREGGQRYRARHPERVRARTRLNTAIRDGKLERGTCEVCAGPAEAHHEDYTQPYAVRWFCKSHHESHHHTEEQT
jgi:hypothetical protein